MKSKKQKKPILDIVDGHNWLNRAYYASLTNKKLVTSKGIEVNAAKTFLSMINALIERRILGRGVCYLAVTFDNKAGSDTRKKIMRKFLESRIRGSDAEKLPQKFLSGYKGNRFTEENDPKSACLKPQIIIIKEILKARGIVVIESTKGEADDVIGSLCDQLNCLKMIWSRDGDFAQLLKPDTRLTLPEQQNSTEQIITYHNCLEKFGVIPTCFVDFLALCGDSSDNIPGIPGVGDKTAAILVNEYGDLDSIFQAELKGVLGKKIKDPFYVDLARMSRDLVEIRRTLKVNTKINDYKLPAISECLTGLRKSEKRYEFKPTLVAG